MNQLCTNCQAYLTTHSEGLCPDCLAEIVYSKVFHEPVLLNKEQINSLLNVINAAILTAVSTAKDNDPAYLDLLEAEYQEAEEELRNQLQEEEKGD